MTKSKGLRGPGQCRTPGCSGETRISHSGHHRVKGVHFRKRRCDACGDEWATYEVPADRFPDYATKSPAAGTRHQVSVRFDEGFRQALVEEAAKDRITVAELVRRLTAKSFRSRRPLHMLPVFTRGKQGRAHTGADTGPAKVLNVRIPTGLYHKITLESERMELTKAALVRDLLVIGLRELRREE